MSPPSRLPSYSAIWLRSWICKIQREALTPSVSRVGRAHGLAMNIQQWIFAGLYRRARSAQTLPWHRDDPPALLERAVADRRAATRALDLGCGTGVNSVYLASKGFAVVGVDFVPRALELARERARAAGVTLELRQADVIDYTARTGFDLVLDSGCLHHLPVSKLSAYRKMLDRWLLPGGDYILVHFGKRHPVDWRPVGPRRKSREAITEYLAPLCLEAYDETVFRLPLPAGPIGLAGVYWFRRPGQSAHPQL